MLAFDKFLLVMKLSQNPRQDFHFHVYPGEFISIVGVSGSGKSTIFRLVTGLDEPSQVERYPLTGNKDRKRLGKVGYMPQQDLLLPWRTILENVCLPLEIAGIDKKTAQQQVMPLLT